MVAPAAHATVYVFSSVALYVPGVTSPNPLGAGDLLQIQAGGLKFFDNVAFVNNGQVDWSDNFYMQSGASIANNGLFNALGDTPSSTMAAQRPSSTTRAFSAKAPARDRRRSAPSPSSTAA
jgi:hypothetical protein